MRVLLLLTLFCGILTFSTTLTPTTAADTSSSGAGPSEVICAEGGYCAADETCVNGYCLDTFGLCDTSAQCSSIQQCYYGYCIWSNIDDPTPVDPDFPEIGDTSICIPSCGSNEICKNNYCRPKPQTIECKQTCRTDLGETCDKQWGVCRVATIPACTNCTIGMCVASPYPGQGLQPQCWKNPFGSTGYFKSCTANRDCEGGITANAVCRQRKCTLCGSFCQSLMHDGSGLSDKQKDEILQLLASIGSSLEDITELVPLTVSGVSEDGSVYFHSGTVTRFDGTTSWVNQTVKKLTFSDANSVAQLASGSLTIPKLVVTAAGAQLLIGSDGGLSASSIEIAANNALSIALAGGSSSGTRSTAAFEQMILNGALNVYGASSSSLRFPQKGSTFTVGDGSQVNVGGGVALSGWGNTVPIRIGSSSSTSSSTTASTNTDDTSSSSTASILAGETFTHDGPVLNGGSSSGSDSTSGSGKRSTSKRSTSKVSSGNNTTITSTPPSILSISGSFIFTGSVFEPTLQLQNGGTVTMDLSSKQSTVLLAGDVKFVTDGTNLGAANSTTSTLRIRAGSSRTAGDNLSFGKIHNCPSSAKITFLLTGKGVRSNALEDGVTIMSYAGLTAAERSQFQCQLEVCDDDGCTQLQNPNVQVNGRRRLFADNSKAAFGATKLTAGGKASAGNGGGDNGNGSVNSATSASTSAGLIVAVMMILAAAMMM